MILILMVTRWWCKQEEVGRAPWHSYRKETKRRWPNGWRRSSKTSEWWWRPLLVTSAYTITRGKSNSNHEKIGSVTCCRLYDVNLNPFSIIFRRNRSRRSKASYGTSVSKYDLWNPNLMAMIWPPKHVSKVETQASQAKSHPIATCPSERWKWLGIKLNTSC